MTDRVAFTVLGKAEPAGSKRAFRHSKTGRVMVADANVRAKPWQSVVAAAGHEAMAGRALLDEPLWVSFTFWQPRPKGHYGTGRNRGVLRASAPDYPMTRPDVLKLARGVEDALTGVCWRDDALIVTETLRKVYDEPARMFVAIYPVGVERGAGAHGSLCAPTPGPARPTDRPAAASFPLSTTPGEAA